MKNRWFRRMSSLLAVTLSVAGVFGSGMGEVVSAAEKRQPAPAAGSALTLCTYDEPVFTRVGEKMIVADAGDPDVAETPAQFYQIVQKHMVARDTAYTVTYKGSYEDIERSASAIIRKVGAIDDPKNSDDGDFLTGSVLHTGYSCSFNSTAARYNFTNAYTDTAEEVAAVNDAVKKALATLAVDGLSDVGKVKVIHDYVVNLLQYDRTLSDHSAYGGLVAKKHTTVCQGYALIMYKMLTEAGVPCKYVTGYAGENHAWNLVKMGNYWYALDATWDDPISSKPVLSYDYFLKGSKTIEKDHALDEDYTTYKLNTKDYSWKYMMQQAGDQVATSQTTREVMNAKVAVNRNDYCQTLEAMLDEAFGYADAGENQRALYDVYKGILEQIVAAIPYMQYYRLKTNDEELFAAFLESADNHISKNIVDPVMKYLDGDDILDDALDLAFEDFDVDELVELEDAELENLLSTYIYQCFNRKLNSYAKKYAADTVDAVVADLEGK